MCQKLWTKKISFLICNALLAYPISINLMPRVLLQITLKHFSDRNWNVVDQKLICFPHCGEMDKMDGNTESTIYFGSDLEYEKFDPKHARGELFKNNTHHRRGQSRLHESCSRNLQQIINFCKQLQSSLLRDFVLKILSIKNTNFIYLRDLGP